MLTIGVRRDTRECQQAKPERTSQRTSQSQRTSHRTSLTLALNVNVLNSDIANSNGEAADGERTSVVAVDEAAHRAAVEYGVAVVEEGVLDRGLLGVEDLQRVVVDVAAQHTVLDVVCETRQIRGRLGRREQSHRLKFMTANVHHP